MGPNPYNLDRARGEAVEAARRMAGEQAALVDALRDIGAARDRAAEGYRAVVQSLTAALEARDGYTGDHSDRVRVLAVAVAGRLGLPDHAVAEVQTVALLHDIGKLGVPDRVLHKPGRLDAREWELMRVHPLIGERILRPLPGLGTVAVAVRHEHERWDGGGYPDGLAGEAIPLASRIVLACDAWHALVSDRPYRGALGPRTARAELERCAGSQFDPAVVAALLESLDDEAFLGAAAERADALLGDPAAADRDRSRQDEDELATLLGVAAAVAGATDLPEVLETGGEAALRALGADALSICRWEADAAVLRTLINVGELAPGERRWPGDETYRLAGDDPLRDLLLRGKTYCGSLEDPDIPPVDRALLERIGHFSCAAVPIMLGGSAWGELWMTRGRGRAAFGPDDVRVLRATAAQLATAIGRAELFSRMADLVLRDQLTGLANRRALDERLEAAVDTGAAGGRELALVLVDLDNLKHLNEAQGHDGGDAALRRTAAVLAEVAGERPGALVARLGGDEFCLLLEHTSRDAARRLASDALIRLAGERPRIDISCGVAAVRHDEAGRPADLLRAADSALYHAKRTGRGRVCVSEDTDVSAMWRAGAPARDRRARRDHAATDVAALLTEATRMLDGPLAGAGRVERLEATVDVCAAAVDASTAALAERPAGTDAIRTVFAIDRRTGQTSTSRSASEGEVFRSSEYPATDKLMAAGGAAVWRRDAPGTEPTEIALLDEWNLLAVLAAAVTTHAECWLVEIYADGATADLESLAGALRALMVQAVYGAPAASSTSSRVPKPVPPLGV